MRRIEFLQEFLGALGAVEIEWHKKTTELISGKVIYDRDDPEEAQEFVWRKLESEVPSQEVINLIKLLRKKKLLSIDQLAVTRSELRESYNIEYGLKTNEHEFSNVLESLEKIEVPMIDDGKETDAYIIHE